jgi:hypothetical protein
LETHRNIPLAGITNDQMYEMIIWDDVHCTPYDIISKLPGVTRLDTTARTHDLGKHNLSTTVDTYVTNTQWIDNNLNAIFDRTTPNTKLKDGPFPDPVRMGKRMTRRAIPKQLDCLRRAPPSTVSNHSRHATSEYPKRMA